MQATICDSCGKVLKRDQDGYTTINLRYVPQKRLKLEELANNDSGYPEQIRQKGSSIPIMNMYGKSLVPSGNSERKHDIMNKIERSIPPILLELPQDYVEICTECLENPVKLGATIQEYRRRLIEYEQIADDFAQQIRVEIRSF